MSEIPAESSPKQYRILLAEDNPVNQKYVAITLRKQNFFVDIAKNGIEAIEFASKNQYDLILMDCGMPEMDGYEATRKIRCGEAGENNKTIVILAVTAFAMPGDRVKCIECGMNDYVTKPVTPTDLLELVLKYLPTNNC